MQGSVIKYEGKRGMTWTFVIDVGRDARRQAHPEVAPGLPDQEGGRSGDAAGTARAPGRHLHREECGDRRRTARPLADTVVRHKVKPTTLEDYALTVRKHLKPALGHIPVQALTAGDGADVLFRPARCRHRARTVQLCHQRLSQALALAEREGIVSRNVCRSPNRQRRRPSRATSWTAEEARRFLDAAESDTYWPLWLLALKTGLRRGELLGLRWQDLDLDKGCSHGAADGRACSTVRPSSSRQRPPPPAGPSSSPPISSRTRQAPHRTGRAAARASQWADADLVFCTRDGKPINPNNVYRNYQAIIDAGGGAAHPTCTAAPHAHDARCWPAARPSRPSVSGSGHSKTSITLDTYTHVLPDMQDRVVDAIDAALS